MASLRETKGYIVALPARSAGLGSESLIIAQPFKRWKGAATVKDYDRADVKPLR